LAQGNLEIRRPKGLSADNPRQRRHPFSKPSPNKSFDYRGLGGRGAAGRISGLAPGAIAAARDDCGTIRQAMIDRYSRPHIIATPRHVDDD
jgi:hypothetical protein